ncbi:MAG: ectoine/hydroxyectoine ABC transporter ATP-binding protein EhuA [Rhodospirillaceae bacterium]|nr:ectoine/hydroxyectoine ABC transporter ATP-binding protein EhuA [Rhodospirillaceae bacterium]
MEQTGAPRAESSIVEFVDVEKSFGSHRVLDCLSFSAKRGDHIALIGPSGSGKTTILRILMTLESISRGDVIVDGINLYKESVNGVHRTASERHVRDVRSKIGMVFQHFNLFPHKSVLANITLAPVLNGKLTKSAAREKALDLLNMVGLADKADAMPASLSGGQKQRVAIARALALEPQILLCDEITSALDPELVEEVLNVIKRLGQQTDMTMLLVTHEMSFAHEFADRVLFLESGRIIEEGTPDRIFSNPEKERTRAFLRKIIAAGHRV